MLCHLGNISYQLGTEAPFKEPIAAFGNDAAADEAWSSMKQHLVDMAGVKLDTDQYRLGRKLAFDADAEQFHRRRRSEPVDHAVLSPPYVVPESV